MLIKKTISRAAGAEPGSQFISTGRATARRANSVRRRARLQKLEQAVSQLQKRNAELEQEVAGIKEAHRLGTPG